LQWGIRIDKNLFFILIKTSQPRSWRKKAYTPKKKITRTYSKIRLRRFPNISELAHDGLMFEGGTQFSPLVSLFHRKMLNCQLQNATFRTSTKEASVKQAFGLLQFHYSYFYSSAFFVEYFCHFIKGKMIRT
jgi:hypothetical protein